jgi:ferrous iron transport protein B
MPATAQTASRVGPAVAAGAGRMALLGNPNTGKTTVFNLLCGSRAKTANFPGTTTSVRSGHCDVGGQRMDVIDLPGVYDLRYQAPRRASCVRC